MNKVCNKYGIEKPIEMFRKSGKYYRGECQECERSYGIKQSRLYRINNKELISKKRKIHYRANIADFIARRNDPINKTRAAIYRINNKEHIMQVVTNWQKNNKNRVNELANIYIKNRRQTDLKFNLDINIGSAISHTLKNKKSGRSWESLVGYTKDDLEKHLESLFTEGMTRDNYGKGKNKWHVGYIILKCAFDYAVDGDNKIKECWALSNLIPQWQVDNFKKIAEDRKLSIKLKNKI